MAELCITSRSEECGRPDLQDAIAHAYARAVALHERQAVVVMRYVPDGPTYYRIQPAAWRRS